jgi:hypothetical protein
MLSRRQSERPSTLKREREKPPDNPITNTSPVPAKRQRKESKASKTTHTMSVAATAINVPNAILQVYQHMLPKNPEGIAFLFGSPFSEALQVPAERVATEYQITKEDAIEELRRLLVIKAFTVDKDANKISPTPLSTQIQTIPLTLY